MYRCIIDKRAFAWYVYVYLYLTKFGFEIYIFENKGLWDEFSLCIFEVWRMADIASCSLQRMGGETLCHLDKLFTWELLQVPTSSYINSFTCIEAFYILLLAFDVIGFAWEFLQVPTSTCSLMVFTFGFWRWCCLRALHWFPSVVAWELLQTLVLTINVVAIVGLSSF